MKIINLPEKIPSPQPFDADEKITNSFKLNVKPYQDIKIDSGRFELEFNSKDSDIKIYEITQFKKRGDSPYQIPDKIKYVIQVEMETSEIKLTDLGDDKNG